MDEASFSLMNRQSNKQLNRIVYYDYLRVFASFAVIIIHVSAQNWYTSDVNGFPWKVFNFYDSIVRWGVPVFVMISGSLFLKREIPLKTMYSKYVLRLVISFFTWAFIYAIFVNQSLEGRLDVLIHGYYHMSFILMIIGIYICMPFIKPLVETSNRMKYYLLLSFVYAFALPEVFNLITDFGSDLIVTGSKAIRSDINNMNMHIVLGYTCYFVLGYFLSEIDLNKRQRFIIYILGILGFAFTIIMDLIVALKTQTPCEKYYDYHTVNVLLEAVAVFTWFKYREYEHHKLNAFVQKLSKYSFGAYLVHVLIIEQLKTRFGFNTLSFYPALAVICIGLAVFAVSYVISAILNRIPIVNRYMV